jgi:hypothetical protein
MAGSFSYQYRSLMLDYGVGQVAWSPPIGFWVALYVSPPGPGDLGIEAIMDAGRISWPNDLTGFGAAVNGVKTSQIALDVPAQSTELGGITSIGWRDSQTGGMLCFSCDLQEPIPMIVGSTMHFDPGDFTINWSG